MQQLPSLLNPLFRSRIISLEGFFPHLTETRQKKSLTDSAQCEVCLSMLCTQQTSGRHDSCSFITESTHKACLCQNSVCLTGCVMHHTSLQCSRSRASARCPGGLHEEFPHQRPSLAGCQWQTSAQRYLGLLCAIPICAMCLTPP